MNIIILLRLLTAHFLADFFLQPDVLAINKKTSSLHLAVHCLINAAVAYLFVAQWSLWIIPLIIFVSHFIIDFVKTRYGNDESSWFILDQVMHILVILGLWTSIFVSPDAMCSSVAALFLSSKVWACLIVFMLMTMPSSLFIERFFRKWLGEVSGYSGLPGGGKWIGYLERILIVAFVLSGNIAGVGFLMTAKSVFRFGDVSKGDLKMTEYMLLGTLMSFSIALIAGFLLKMIV